MITGITAADTTAVAGQPPPTNTNGVNSTCGCIYVIAAIGSPCTIAAGCYLEIVIQDR